MEVETPSFLWRTPADTQSLWSPLRASLTSLPSLLVLAPAHSPGDSPLQTFSSLQHMDEPQNLTHIFLLNLQLCSQVSSSRLHNGAPSPAFPLGKAQPLPPRCASLSHSHSPPSVPHVPWPLPVWAQSCVAAAPSSPHPRPACPPLPLLQLEHFPQT